MNTDKKPISYSYAFSFMDGMAHIIRKSGTGFINKYGELAVPCIYEMAYSYFDGLAMVQKGKKKRFYR